MLESFHLPSGTAENQLAIQEQIDWEIVVQEYLAENSGMPVEELLQGEEIITEEECDRRMNEVHKDKEAGLPLLSQHHVTNADQYAEILSHVL